MGDRAKDIEMYVQRFVFLSLLVLAGCIDLEPRPVTSVADREVEDMDGVSALDDGGISDRNIDAETIGDPSEVCDVDQLSSGGAEDCVISTTVQINSGTYRFNTLKITREGRLIVKPQDADERSTCGGYPGQSDTGHPMKGGGCLRLIVHTLEVKGSIGARYTGK